MFVLFRLFYSIQLCVFLLFSGLQSRFVTLQDVINHCELKLSLFLLLIFCMTHTLKLLHLFLIACICIVVCELLLWNCFCLRQMYHLKWTATTVCFPLSLSLHQTACRRLETLVTSPLVTRRWTARMTCLTAWGGFMVRSTVMKCCLSTKHDTVSYNQNKHDDRIRHWLHVI